MKNGKEKDVIIHGQFAIKRLEEKVNVKVILKVNVKVNVKVKVNLKNIFKKKKSACKTILYDIRNNNIIFTCPICDKTHSLPSSFSTTEVYYKPFISRDGITHFHDKNEEKQDCICETTGKKMKLIKKKKCKNCDWYYPIECNDNEVIIDKKK